MTQTNHNYTDQELQNLSDEQLGSEILEVQILLFQRVMTACRQGPVYPSDAVQMAEAIVSEFTSNVTYQQALLSQLKKDISKLPTLNQSKDGLN